MFAGLVWVALAPQIGGWWAGIIALGALGFLLWLIVYR